MPKPVIRAVIFDYNGTLLNDARKFYEDGFRRALEKYGITLPPYEILRKTFSRLGPDDFVELLADLYSLEITWEGDVNPLVSRLLEGVPMNLANGARYVLDQLYADRVPMALISGLRADLFEQAIDQKKIRRYFAKTRGGLKVKTKTTAAFVRSQDCDPREVLFISDIQKDLFEAQKVGCFTVGITHGYGPTESLQEAEPDEVIDSFSEFFDIANFVPLSAEKA